MSTRLTIRVKCPKCSWQQNTSSVKGVKCYGCGHFYKIFPKTRRQAMPSRVVKIIAGNMAQLHREIYRQKVYNYGKG